MDTTIYLELLELKDKLIATDIYIQYDNSVVKALNNTSLITLLQEYNDLVEIYNKVDYKKTKDEIKNKLDIIINSLFEIDEYIEFIKKEDDLELLIKDTSKIIFKDIITFKEGEEIGCK
ncbi:YlbF family regulator [Mycoplasma sp. P36-A1]|uniref:YlbF family regulator n=1 Tax=Mycoplasma sp. P36-A1 TaxID=3252900 RepID=UPI003C307FAF